MQFIDPALPKSIDRWKSPSLGLDMPIVRYGTTGQAILLYPTAAADFLENERFFLVKAVEPLIMAGRIQLYSIDSINSYAWMDRDVPVKEQARRQALYSSYVEEEVVPFIRHTSGRGDMRPITTGASFGCFHAANQCFRRPDLFGGLIGMAGFYDLSRAYFKGYSDEHCYFNNPMWYVRNLDGGYLDLLRSRTKIVIATGQGAFEVPEASRKFARLLTEKGIPHWLDVWGTDVNHDWPWWRRMLPYFIEQLGY
ncbi:MAG: alpha/beta hydrolase-fold protein [Gemmatimonadaceae bacterium]|jgi:esterase/lipase superfamily enzyme|nr:alpha/beta hydrolase-fold protein [Gemmatimonadaceae bacterium]